MQLSILAFETVLLVSSLALLVYMAWSNKNEMCKVHLQPKLFCYQYK